MGVKITCNVKLDLKELRKLKQRVKPINNGHVDVGFFGGKIHPSRGDKGEEYTIAEIAAIHELGLKAPHIPQRGFMRLTEFQHKAEYAALTKREMQGVMLGTTTFYNMLRKLGVKYRDDMKLEIALFNNPENAKNTIRAKGFNAPLVETGTMLHDVDFRINK